MEIFKKSNGVSKPFFLATISRQYYGWNSHLLHSPDNKLVPSFFFKKANNSYLPIPALPPALLFIIGPGYHLNSGRAL